MYYNNNTAQHSLLREEILEKQTKLKFVTTLNWLHCCHLAAKRSRDVTSYHNSRFTSILTHRFIMVGISDRLFCIIGWEFNWLSIAKTKIHRQTVITNNNTYSSWICQFINNLWTADEWMVGRHQASGLRSLVMCQMTGWMRCVLARWRPTRHSSAICRLLINWHIQDELNMYDYYYHLSFVLVMGQQIKFSTYYTK